MENQSLYSMEPDGSHPRLLFSNIRADSVHLTFDPFTKTVLVNSWAQPQQILKVEADSPQAFEYLDGPSQGGQGLAVDASAGKIFVGIYYAGLFVKDFHGQGEWSQIVYSQEITPLLGQRGQLQVDPVHQHVYFRTAFNGDCGECRWIYRVDYDGKNLTKIIRANAGDALVLDLKSSKIYFSDIPAENTIKRANLDGSNVETILTLPEGYIFSQSIALDESTGKIFIYLFEDERNIGKQAIARFNLDGSEFEIIREIQANGTVQGGLAVGPSQDLPAVYPACGVGWTRLEIGPNASISSDSDLSNRVRQEPGLAGKVIGRLPPGAIVKILEGPVCADGFVYWKVQSPLIPAGTGWTAEGDGKEYYLTTNHLLLSTKTDLEASVKIDGDRYVFQIAADRVLPDPAQLAGGARVDFIWSVDADMNRNTGQTQQGNDYNINLTLTENGWFTDIYAVSPIALDKEVQDRYAEIQYQVNGQQAEISFPVSFFPQNSFTWWLEVTSTNSSMGWQDILKYPITISESTFTGEE